MNKKGIIFDLDGTLWNTLTQVVPAWNIVLNKHSELDKKITIDDMKGFMGKTINVIAKIMFPEMDLEKSVKILEECCNEELIYLRKHGGILYPKLEDTLKLLSENYPLYIVSNCQDGYVQAFLDYHKLWSYFKDIEMSGRTGKSKGENIKIIIERNKLKESVYVGDTNGDLEGANYAGISFIYAEYGFGQLDDVKYSIKNIFDINRIIGNIL
jgi:phosphoglycolate phosphatase